MEAVDVIELPGFDWWTRISNYNEFQLLWTCPWTTWCKFHSIYSLTLMPFPQIKPEPAEVSQLLSSHKKEAFRATQPVMLTMRQEKLPDQCYHSLEKQAEWSGVEFPKEAEGAPFLSHLILLFYIFLPVTYSVSSSHLISPPASAFSSFCSSHDHMIPQRANQFPVIKSKYNRNK